MRDGEVEIGQYRIHDECTRITRLIQLRTTLVLRFAVPRNITKSLQFFEVEQGTEKARYATIVIDNFGRLFLIGLPIVDDKVVDVVQLGPGPARLARIGRRNGTPGN